MSAIVVPNILISILFAGPCLVVIIFLSYFWLPLFFPVFISSPHVHAHLVSFCTHSSAWLPATPTLIFSPSFALPPLSQFAFPTYYSGFILPITTFTARYSNVSFTYIHITSFHTLPLPYSSGKSNI